MNEELKALIMDVEQTETRTRHFLGYWRAGAYVQLWGAVWFCAYLASFFFPLQSGWIWLAANLAGIAGSILLSLVRTQAVTQNIYKGWVAFAIVMLFAVLASSLIGNKPQALSVFWSCLFMTIYMIAGLWWGIRWTILGASLAVLIILSYLFLAPWFNLLMALLGGGGLMLGGTWLRKAT